MKVSMIGTELAGYIAPLEAKVRQYEGIDYDMIWLAVNECKDKKYLDGKVKQPGYDSYMHLNLSGMKSDDPEIVGADPIDADAVPVDKGKCFLVKYSDLKSANRIVGANKGSFNFDETKKFIVNVGKTMLYKAAKLISWGINIPTPHEQKDVVCTFSDFVPDGSSDAVELGCALAAAIRVSSVSGSKGELRTRAIHMVIDGGRLKVEASTLKSKLLYPVQCTLNKESENDFTSPVHVAISLNAAKSLQKMCVLSGGTIYWKYSVYKDDEGDEQGEIYFNCFHYAIRINTEKVDCCSFPSMNKTSTMTMVIMKCDLLYDVYRIKVAGYKNLQIKWNDEYLSVASPDKVIESTVRIDSVSGFEEPCELTLATDNLHAVLNAFDLEHAKVNLKFDYENDFIVACEEDTGIQGIVYSV